jgi:hypothetical protein
MRKRALFALRTQLARRDEPAGDSTGIHLRPNLMQAELSQSNPRGQSSLYLVGPHTLLQHSVRSVTKAITPENSWILGAEQYERVIRAQGFETANLHFVAEPAPPAGQRSGQRSTSSCAVQFFL